MTGATPFTLENADKPSFLGPAPNAHVVRAVMRPGSGASARHVLSSVH